MRAAIVSDTAWLGQVERMPKYKAMLRVAFLGSCLAMTARVCSRGLLFQKGVTCVVLYRDRVIDELRNPCLL